MVENELFVINSSFESITFWKLYDYKCVKRIDGVFTFDVNHMVELPNGSIALSVRSCKSFYPIIIINVKIFTVIKEIKLEGYIINNSNLCIFNNDCFIYVYDRYFVQISPRDYKVMFKSNRGKCLNGEVGIISLKGGKFFGIVNKNNGFTVIEPTFKK